MDINDIPLGMISNYYLSVLTGRSSGGGNEWQLTPVFLPGESHGQRGLVGYGLWGCKEFDTTKPLTHTHRMIYIYIFYFIL